MRIHLQVHDLDVASVISQVESMLSRQVILRKDILVQLARESSILWVVQIEALHASGWGDRAGRVWRDLLRSKGTALIGHER